MTKAVKLFADFYASDLIVCSPLGLRLVVGPGTFVERVRSILPLIRRRDAAGTEGDAERDYDFLSSIEVLVMDQAEVFSLQNFAHLKVFYECRLWLASINHAVPPCCVGYHAAHERQTLRAAKHGLFQG